MNIYKLEWKFPVAIAAKNTSVLTGVFNDLELQATKQFWSSMLLGSFKNFSLALTCPGIFLPQFVQDHLFFF